MEHTGQKVYNYDSNYMTLYNNILLMQEYLTRGMGERRKRERGA